MPNLKVNEMFWTTNTLKLPFADADINTITVWFHTSVPESVNL